MSGGAGNDPVVDRIYDTIAEWGMTALQKLELAGRLSRDGLDELSGQVAASLGVDNDSDDTGEWSHVLVRARDQRAGMTVDELSSFVELLGTVGVPGSSRLKVLVGFGGQLRAIESRDE